MKRRTGWTVRRAAGSDEGRGAGGHNSCGYLCAAVANERPPAAAAAAAVAPVAGFMKTHIKVQRGRGGERFIGCVNQECKTHHQLYVQVL